MYMESFELFGFNIYAWITIVTVLSMFTVLLLTKLRTDLVFLGAIAILFVTGVLDAKEAFSGFSSTSVVVQYHRRGPLREYRQDVVEET